MFFLPFKLVLRDFRKQKARMLFAFLAIVAVSCLVVWFVSGIKLDLSGNAEAYYGKFHLALSHPQNIPPEILSAVEKLEREEKTVWVAPALQLQCDARLEDFEESLAPTGMGDRKCPAVLGLKNVKDPPFEMEDGRWIAARGECVIGDSGIELLTAVAGKKSDHTVKLGDTIRIKRKDGSFLALKIVGRLEQETLKDYRKNSGGMFQFGFGAGIGGGTKTKANVPQKKKPVQMEKRKRPVFEVSPTNPSIYMTYEDALTLRSGRKGNESINLLFIQLPEGTEKEDFIQILKKEAGTALSPSQIHDPAALKKQQETLSPEKLLTQAWSVIGLVILASVFIIFTTLNMGVSEKIRVLAMLRTAGLTRFQVAAYILLEGLLLGLAGGIAGLGAGWLLIAVIVWLDTGLLPAVVLPWMGIIFAIGTSLAGSLIAAIVPAIRATRISPVENMNRARRPFCGKTLFLMAFCGVVLLLCIPCVILKVDMEQETRMILFSTLGTLLFAGGFLLIAPWLIRLTERIFAPILARCLALHPLLLVNTLSANRRRSVCTAIAVSIGLSLFTAIHIWSTSLLTMFIVPDTIPPAVVRFQEEILDDTLPEKVRSMPGIKKEYFMSFSVAQPELSPDLQEIMQSKGAMAGNTVVFGVRGDDAWRLEDPMFRFDFVEGSREQALIDFRLKDQRVCVIPQTLAKSANLHAGDTLRLKKSLRHGKMKTTEYVEYRVAAVIDFPWVWLSKCSGVRVSAGRTAACIFAPYEQVIRDFGALENEFFWFDVEKGVTHQKIVDEMRSIAADLAGKKRVRSGTGRSISGGTVWDSGINRNHVQVSTIESLNNSLLSRSGGVIDTMTQMPLVILLLSTLAVLNTMIVSVRSRRWEMGVLRACGMTRGGLVRMIAAESILMGICACIMSLASGVFYAYLALKLVDFAPMFGIIAPEMLIPWSKLFYGFALTLGVCFCAGIVPAITAGMADTTTLLQRKE